MERDKYEKIRERNTKFLEFASRAIIDNIINAARDKKIHMENRCTVYDIRSSILYALENIIYFDISVYSNWVDKHIFDILEKHPYFEGKLKFPRKNMYADGGENISCFMEKDK